ncbi:hypothetical protein [Amycolatopsis sp. GM8]|uniref:hypothetical protein n=1 Tax=Amycolatopsis sp. GM8 TaxID=2896530 RepID=UPI001F2EBEAB|nr:hypothetical protein [Amycolatopsis sp. GM8]
MSTADRDVPPQEPDRYEQPDRASVPTVRPDRQVVTRTSRATTWVGWHLAEVVGVLAPLVLALTVWVGFASLSLLVAIVWAVHEYRTRGGAR